MAEVSRPALLAALRMTVRGGLGGVWVRGRLPAGPVVWAANHHSWWDPFIAGTLLSATGRRMVLLADVANVHQYRFARRIGVVGTDELRTALAAVRGGATLVIYPEGQRLPAALAGLRAQDVTEIIVLDDQSTDDTAAVVRHAAQADPRVRLLGGTPPPPGWAGKNWACRQLAAAARGDVLLFCDADVLLAPGAVDACLAQMRAQRADVFSVFPRQRTDTFGERVLVPLIDDVLLAFLPHRLLRLPVPPAATANGQLMMFRRSAYDALGGHAAVAGEINEDIALARLARRAGLRLGLALGGDLAGARMYGGYLESVRGFGKSLRAAHGGRDSVLALSAAWHLLAYTVPWLAWRRGRAWRAVAVLGLAQRVLVNLKTGRGALGEAALVPVTPLAALPAYGLAFRREAEWKGRRYPDQARARIAGGRR